MLLSRVGELWKQNGEASVFIASVPSEVYGSLEQVLLPENYSLIQIPLIQHLKPVPIILCVRMGMKLTVTVCVNQLFEQYGPFIFPESGSVVYAVLSTIKRHRYTETVVPVIGFC
jgi:hypothetical protein